MGEKGVAGSWVESRDREEGANRRREGWEGARERGEGSRRKGVGAVFDRMSERGRERGASVGAWERSSRRGGRVCFRLFIKKPTLRCWSYLENRRPTMLRKEAAEMCDIVNKIFCHFCQYLFIKNGISFFSFQYVTIWVLVKKGYAASVMADV